MEQLRQVFSELQAHTVRDYVAFPRYYQLFDSDGGLKDPEGPNSGAKVLLDQLLWWGSILHDARRDRPYATANQRRVRQGLPGGEVLARTPRLGDSHASEDR